LSKRAAREQIIPALGYRWLTPIFDSVLSITMRDSVFKRQLVEQAGFNGTQRVLDIGCGTGTMMQMIKLRHPELLVVGVDGDREILNLATRKAFRTNLDVKFNQATSTQLPFADASFDRVVSTLVLHHLDRESKTRTLDEMFRVLRPGGQLHVADWGKASNLVMRLAFFSVQLLDGFATTADNVQGRVPDFIRNTGLVDVEETAQISTIFGTLSFYRAAKP